MHVDWANFTDSFYFVGKTYAAFLIGPGVFNDVTPKVDLLAAELSGTRKQLVTGALVDSPTALIRNFTEIEIITTNNPITYQHVVMVLNPNNAQIVQVQSLNAPVTISANSSQKLQLSYRIIKL